MNGLLLRCTAATLLTLGSFTTVATAQQPNTDNLFDAAAPNPVDNLPPDASAKESLSAPPATPDAPNSDVASNPAINQQALPFNPKRIDLIETLQQMPKSVTVAGQQVKLLNPARVAAFYEEQQYPTIWTQDDSVTDLVTQLQTAIADSKNDALNPNRYHKALIDALTPESKYQNITSLELLMTDAYLALAGDLANGLVDPHITSPSWDAPKVSDTQLGNLLATAFLQKNVVKSLASLNADDPYYQTLKQQYLEKEQGTSTSPISSNDLIINMERLRWMPQHWGSRYIIANIPAYQVDMVDNGKTIYNTRAVVGRRDRPTPRFTNTLRYVVMAPTWTVPPTIMKKDELPKLRKNAAAFDANFEAVSNDGKTVLAPSQVDWSSPSANAFMLRQKPGPHNALGRVKFLFPNKHSIYLHDTPHRNLFKNQYRARSSGCIRLNDPLELADVLLNDTAWTPAKIKTQTRQKSSKWVKPSQPVPIYLVYWSTWASLDGQVHHAKDVYRLDGKLINAYKKALTQ